MGNYEHELAQWVKDARKDPRKPIDTAITLLRRARKEVSEATLENRHKKLQHLGLAFDEATVLFEPSMPRAIKLKLQPISKGFEAALSAYSDAARQRRGFLLMERDQITQQELDILKHDAGRFLDQLIKWFVSLPA